MIESLSSSTDAFCLPCALCRSVWCPSSGHAKLHAWGDASIWAGSSNGAPLPGRPSHGHEAACHVSGWTLLKQQSSHHIRFEVNTFLSSLCFFKPSCLQRAVRPVVVKTSNSLEHMDIKCNIFIGKQHNTTQVLDSYLVVIWLHVRIYFFPIGFTQVYRSEVCLNDSYFFWSCWSYMNVPTPIKGKFIL